MITPFSEDYAVLERAVRAVFEAPPFFFEVVLARDHRHKAQLLSNVRAHMARAHGFVAEITDLNSNVMLELGGVLMLNGNRPVFALRRADAPEEVPSDLKAELYVEYESLSQSSEALARTLRERFWKDGRPADFGVQQLLQERKRLFLSRTLLQQLHLRVDDDDRVSSLMNRFEHVEDVIETDPAVLQELGFKEWQATSLQGELRDLVEAAGDGGTS